MNEDTYFKEYDKQQKMIKKTEDFINKNIVRASTTKRAQSRQKMLDKIEVLEKPQSDKKVFFDFKFTKSFNTDALIVKDLSIGYDEPILSNLNFKFEFGNKYVITGKNGIGKTTFLKTILKEIPAKAGEIKSSQYNDISYYKQEVLTDKQTAMEYFRNDYPLLTDKDIRGILAKYAIIGELAIKEMNKLSGGEAAKVHFAKMSLERSNLLILDEPTNHLDKAAKKSLFKAIEEYPGTVILVSHEKQFYKQLNMKEINF
jgi:ATPase subunit of ABC transporter with duplicated ATPase domains